METRILGLLILVTVAITYVLLRRGFEKRRMQTGRQKSLRWTFGALVIALIWILDDLFACADKSCDPQFIAALRFERVDFFVLLFYVHLLFAAIEAFFYLRPLSPTGPVDETKISSN